MEKKKWTFGIYLTVLALVFSIGLTFASVEMPRLLHSALVKATPALEGDSHGDETTVYRTELFMDHYHFRLIGYACFGLMVVLIVAGFASGKAGLSAAGAAAMFLPVFAQFAGVMFFLAGLGFLNLAWLPMLDISFDVGRLGDIVYWPYDALVSLFARWGIDVHGPLVYTAIGAGLLLFVLGTLTWFVARNRKQNVADFWVYRLSRHPQYLGWIVWSYGMLLSLKRIRYPRRSWGIPASLPWLLSMMVIVGVALLEERKMKRLSGEAYDAYRKKTSFLLPLPRFLRAAFAAPNRLLFGRSLPERKGEIAVVLVLATAVLMASSHFYARHRRYAQIAVPSGIVESEAARVVKLVEEMKRAGDWRRKSRIADALADIGGPAADPLIGLLDEPDPEARQEAARALGLVGADRAVGPLLVKLSDENVDVRIKVVDALGRLRAEEAVEPLVAILESRVKDLSRVAAVALGRIGSETAVEPLLGFLDSPNWWDRAAAVDALGEIGSEDALELLLARLEGEDVHVRRSTVVALLKIGSERALEPLERALQDEDREVRLFAAEALKRLRARVGIPGPDSCTIVMAARDGLALAGNNEDRNHLETIVNFIPASGSFHGRVVFGYDDAFVQGGMNDQGLFIDGNALRPTGWQPDPGKPTFRGIVMMSILATCATCEDVKAFFERSNVPALAQARFPVADRTGASMVVEYGQGHVQFVRSDTWYQIATNFVMSNVNDGEYPCWRYKAADKIMSGAKELSVDLVRDVLEKTHQEGNSLTVYSNIYDLKRRIVYVYNLRDFKKAVVLDLAEELKKGQRRLDLPSLFKPLEGGMSR
jgi:HEAT repeat protein/protein-S-isoprenylcysteine O-methyltransferase Ste14